MKFIKKDFTPIKNDKKIAILLATCNSCKYIREMLDSLVLQTYEDFKVFIHDDGSKDDTQVILTEYIDKYPDMFIPLVYPATGSAKANFFSMLEAVESDFYMFADHDDVWLKEKIKKSYEKIVDIEANYGKEKIFNINDINKKIDTSKLPFCAFTDMYVAAENLDIIAPSTVRFIGRDPYALNYQRIIIDNPAPGCSMIFNKNLRDLALNAKDLDNIDMHDHFVITIAAACGEVGFIDEPLSYYRQHGDNEMGAGDSEGKSDKISRNLKDFFNGSFSKNKRDFNMIHRKLAKELLNVEGLQGEVRAELIELSEIGSKGKLERMKFYGDHGFDRKSGNFWFRMWV